MGIFELHFSTRGSAVELVRTRFSHPTLPTLLECARGRGIGAHSHLGAFQWTSAVQALAVLMLRSAAALSSDRNGVLPTLQGSAGSFASSLDFSIRKNSSWLQQMFGKNAHGRVLSRRLFPRANSGMKRVGPVTVGVNRMLLGEIEISIYVNGELESDPARLATLAASIEADWRPHHQSSRTSRCAEQLSAESESEISREQAIRPLLSVVIRDEILSSLRMTDIFSEAGFQHEAERLANCRAFSSMTGRHFRPFSELDYFIGRRQRDVSLQEDENVRRLLTQDPPIRVGLAVIPSAASALFYYLKLIKGYNLDFQVSAVDTGQLVRSILSQSDCELPDLFSMGAPSAARLFALPTKHEYRPFMLFPKFSARFVASPGLRRNPKNPFEHPCRCVGPEFYVERLEDAGVLKERKMKLIVQSPSEIFQSMKVENDDGIALLFAPHHQINVALNKCRYLDDRYYPLALENSIAVAHSAFLGQKARAEALCVALRNAWITLRNGGPELDTIVGFFTSDPGYMRPLCKAAGITSGVTPLFAESAVG